MANKKKKTTQSTQSSNTELKRFLLSVAVVGFSIVGWFRFGVLGELIDNLMRVLTGHYPWIYYVFIIFFSLVYLIKPSSIKRPGRFWIGVASAYLAFVLFQFITFGAEGVGISVITKYTNLIPTIFQDVNQPAYSGLIGALIYGLMSYLLGREGVLVFGIIFAIVGVVLIVTPRRLSKMWSKTSNKTKSTVQGFKKKDTDKPSKLVPVDIDSMIDKNYDEKNETLFNDPIDGAVLRDDLHNVAPTSAQFMDANFGKEMEDVAVVSKPLEVQPLPEKSVDSKDLREEPVDSFKTYKIPPVTLLESMRGITKSTANAGSAKQKADRLLEVLRQFGIDATLIDIHIGPAVTKFELKPDSNVKISKISSIQDNLMMELAVKTLRIEAPIPGKSAVGIEIPNVEMIPVKMRDVIQQTPHFNDKNNINVALGKDLMGNPITIALNKMPHLLVAGATGSGKSVCMNSIITSILLTKNPEELKLLLIDPKKVEFTPYTSIPHLIGPVINDPSQASKALKVVVDEMDSRYDLFSKAGVRNIGSYNEKVKAFPEERSEPLPWIVVVIDELADLMAVAGKEVETSIQRITQLARAAGIHLIVATQRPSVDVVTGIIKANIPSRIAFAVSSAIDSRTILDATGAEKLLGYGDMLYIPMGEPNTIRVQGCYVSDEEVRRIAERSSSQAKPRYVDAFIQLDGVDGNNGIVGASEDPLFQEAVDFVIMEQRASTSLLQRRFKIGYNRAANLIDTLEQNGIIGHANGSKPREVFKRYDSE